eukprot:566442-Pelagomonas_calceolata.AAC.6
MPLRSCHARNQNRTSARAHTHTRSSPPTTQLRLQAAANAGSTAALLSLSDRYFTGLGVPRSPHTALQYANLAARQIAQDVEKSHSKGRPWANRRIADAPVP